MPTAEVYPFSLIFYKYIYNPISKFATERLCNNCLTANQSRGGHLDLYESIKICEYNYK